MDFQHFQFTSQIGYIEENSAFQRIIIKNGLVTFLEADFCGDDGVGDVGFLGHSPHNP